MRRLIDVLVRVAIVGVVGFLHLCSMEELPERPAVERPTK